MPAQGNPTPPLVGGVASGVNRGNMSTLLQDYVFQSGIHKPEHSSFLSYLYPQYYLTALLDRLGDSEAVSQDVFSWNEMDRTRISDTISATGVDGTTVTIELTTSTDSINYFIAGDIVRNENGDLFKVNSVGTNGGVQTLTVEFLNDNTATIDADVDLAVGLVIGHVGTTYDEASTHPNGRLYLPDEEFNYTHIFRRGNEVSGSEFTNRTYLDDGKSWYWTQQELDMKEFALDKEATFMFGVRGSRAQGKSMRGLWDYVSANGYEQNYAQTATAADIEEDVQTMIRELMVRGCSNELTIMAGSKLMERLQTSFKDYAIDGALSYGSFGANTAGLDFQAYKFMGIRLNFVYYRMFDDDTIVPYSGAPSASKIDFSDTGLVLDFGTGGGMSPDRKIKMKHKELNGDSRKFISYVTPGIMQPQGENGGITPNGNDFFSYGFLSECSLEVRGSHTMGILRANS